MTRRFSQTARRQQVRGEYPSCPTFAVFGSPPSGSTPAAYHVVHEREMTVGVAEAMLPRSVAIMLHCRTRPRTSSHASAQSKTTSLFAEHPIPVLPAHRACDTCRRHATTMPTLQSIGLIGETRCLCGLEPSGQRDQLSRLRCTTNSMSHTVTKANATSMPTISIQLSCQPICDVISSPVCGAAH